MNLSIIPIIKGDTSFTPYYFYSEFLQHVADHYRKNREEQIKFSLVDNQSVYTNAEYYIDPISIPLLLSLCQQLKEFHEKPLHLDLTNDSNTIHIIEYLYRSDFFHIAGNNINPNYPLGRNIFSYDDRYIGWFRGIQIKPEHKIRCYSLLDDGLINATNVLNSEEEKRDYLVEYFTYKTRDHFSTILNENEYVITNSSLYIEVLSELITNGVLHSASPTYALMFSDKHKIKFSVSDNGIGLYKSLEKKKTVNVHYDKMNIYEHVKENYSIANSPEIMSSLAIIFEALYYSMLKDRKGLFDLIENVILNCSGIFRIHTEYSQLIITSRLIYEIEKLAETRGAILQCHYRKMFHIVTEVDYNSELQSLAVKCKKHLHEFIESMIRKHTIDTRYSSIRLFPVKFKGVHIEVEIPKN